MTGRALPTLALGVGLLLGAPPVPAQQAHDPRPAYHPLAFGTADGTAGDGETEVYDLRVPLAYTLIPVEDGRWGLRLRLIVYAGIYDFLADEDPDLELRFQSLAATPGVELLLPVGGGWLLKPFAEIGYTYDFENDIGAGVWSAGLRTLVTWDIDGTALSLGTELQYLSTFTSDLGVADDFGEALIGLDARRPVGLKFAGNELDFGIYYIRREFVDAVFESTAGGTVDVASTNEIGFSFGTAPPTTLWFVRLPRIGLGYRWGPDVRGVRLNFGFPF
jgi:hypothetical protein